MQEQIDSGELIPDDSIGTQLATLPVEERAELVLKFEQVKERLGELVKESATITEITNADGFEQCHTARMKLKETRVALTKNAKEARDDAVKFGKAVVKKEKELVDLITPEEDRLDVIESAWTAAREAEKAAKKKAEDDAKAALQKRIDDVRNLPLAMVGKSSTEILAAITNLATIDFDDFAGTQQMEANSILALTRQTLQSMHDGAELAEKESERLRIQKEENDARAAKLAQDEADAVARRAEEDRKAQERRDQQEADAKAERDKADAKRKADQEAEDARIAKDRADQAKKDADARAELKRQQDIIDDAKRAKAQQEADDKLAEDQRVAKEKADQEAADAAQARSERLAALHDNCPPLVEAALDALTFLESIGYADDDITITLSIAIENAGMRTDATTEVTP